MLTVILQQGINGIVMGGLYVLVALGLTLIYGVLVQINFAHADIVTLGAFAAYFIAQLLSGNYFLGIAVAILVGGVLGWLINAAIFTPLREQRSELLPLIATIGVSIMLQNAMLLLFGPIPYAFNTPYSSRVIHIGSLFFTLQPADHPGINRNHCFALCVYEIHFPWQGAARGIARPRHGRPNGNQSQFPDHADFHYCLGAGGDERSAAWTGACPHSICRDLGDRQSVRHRDHRRLRQCRRNHHCWTDRWFDRKLHDPVSRSWMDRYRGLRAAPHHARSSANRADRREAR